MALQVPPDPNVTGYFNWRRNLKGKLYCEKILAVHRNTKKNSQNHQEKEQYYYDLVMEYPLNEVQWKDSLASLAWVYPAPVKVALPNA